MRRLLSALIIVALSAQLAFCDSIFINNLTLNSGPQESRFSTTMRKLKAAGDGVTFYADYTGDTADAEYAVGSPTATFTASRGASNPATYIDAQGVIQTTITSNQPRFTKGFYSTSGFVSRPGLLIEAAGTNLVIRTDGTAYAGAADASLWTGWTTTGTITGTPVTNNIACPELSSISSATTQRFQYTGVAGDAPDKLISLASPNSGAASVVQNDVITISCWMRSVSANSGCTIKLELDSRNNAGAFLSGYVSSDISASITSSWKRFSLTSTITDATSDRCNFKITVGSVGNGDVADYEIYGVQVEKNPYATSWIPTAASALTRNAETLTYLTAGNRTAASETLFVKYTLMGIPSAASQFLLDTGTKARRFYVSNGTLAWFANQTDSNACNRTYDSADSAFTSYVAAGTCQHSSPYETLFRNGTKMVVDETADDFADNAWDANFTVGTTYAGASAINGIIQKVAIFGRALSSTEVASVSNSL